jgi:hypothetical protein
MAFAFLGRPTRKPPPNIAGIAGGFALTTNAWRGRSVIADVG